MPAPIDPNAAPAPAPPQDPTAGLSDHDKAMLQKVDDAHKAAQPPAPAAPPAAPARPENIPEKFWDPATGTVRTDELLKSYAELEKARSQPAPQDPPKDPVEGEPAPAPAAPAGKPDFVKMAAEVQATGQVSEESLKALEAVGLNKEVAEQFIAGQRALAAQRDAEGFAAAGGEESYKAMLSWAATSWSPEQQEAYNAAVSPKASKASMLLAVQSLKAAFEAANGRQPNLLQGNAPGSGQGAFASNAEMTAAMRDPRYRTDPAYRAEVERRVGLMSF